ncbi:MAG: DUF1538 domain-containing protein [Clostridia bacterium]|nr:DUF1538 domain-containing protein [Clostridia bacterium]
MHDHTILEEKLRESLASVLPITLIVAALCFFVVPVPPDLMLLFLVSSVLLVVGMALFTIGADMAMTPIGGLIGTRMIQTRNLPLILLLSFLLGVAITVSEPDLQVLAKNVPHIHSGALILTVAVGVGLFLAVALARILFAVPLRWLLIVFYGAVFALAFLADRDFLSVAFDSGGVTTGPMTVPFIMALGVGVSSIRSDKNAAADSFGLVSLCSIGPILAVLLLGFLSGGSSTAAAPAAVQALDSTVALGRACLEAMPHYALEVSMALSPIVIFFLLFAWMALSVRRRQMKRILVGVAATFLGLVLFLTGVNVGFSPMGQTLGAQIVSGKTAHLLVPVAALMGWFVIAAEPAVHVLTAQVEEVSAGAIAAAPLRLALSVAVSAAVALAMVRVRTGLPILWILLPGYGLALLLSFVTPPIFTAIAFDSGGVASGPMTATFLLPMAMGACGAIGGNVAADAFGLVALVAMTPLITIQVMGAGQKLLAGRRPAAPAAAVFDDLEVIELWQLTEQGGD